MTSAYATLLVVLVVLPFLGSAVAAVLPTNARNAEAYLAGGIAAVCLLIVIVLFSQVGGGEAVRQKFDWIPELGLHFTLRVDGFAWVLAALVTGIGLLIVLYARYYMSPSDPVPRFFSFLLAFMGAMLGIALSGNLIQLVFFWELTSIFSFLLIGYWHHTAQARDGARMALIVTTIGGLCLFGGVLIIGQIVGSYDLDRVLVSGATITRHPLYLPALVLVLIGAFTKSAQFPFHFWLPQAMAAPTPVSAYLHSATMVKAGVFLLVRLWPALGGTNEWLWLVAPVGLVTFILGAFIAMFQQDLKGLLAYSTISHLGLITLLIGLDTPIGQVAAIFHIMNHATFKASLFMAAGIIDHETGTRDLRRLSGLWHYMPITATLAVVAAAAMAGVPLLNGFLSKEMFFAETIEIHNNSLIDRALPYIVTVASMFTVAYSVRFIRESFFGPRPKALPRIPGEPPFLMRFPAGLLVAACLVVGVAPALTIGPILLVAVQSVLGNDIPYYSLAIWHGFTPALVMSMFALLGGVSIYFAFRSFMASGEGAPLLRHLNGPRIFDFILVGISWRIARRLEALFGTRRLQPQLQLVACAALIAGLLPFYFHGYASGSSFGKDFDLTFAILWAIGIACALGAANQAKYHRLVALILLGGAGLVTSLSFVWLSAPDLALTQLVVEVVTTVLLLLGLRWLPKRLQSSEPSAEGGGMFRWYRLRDVSIAAAVGCGLAALAYALMTRPPLQSIAGFFVENAYTGAGGTNIVNVILVDFRAFDTYGEITVLCIVAITVYALLRRFRPAADSIPVPEQQQSSYAPGKKAAELLGEREGNPIALPAIVMSLLFPVIAALAAYFLLRGHDQPGGGFVAGVVMAVAFILQYLAGGTAWVEHRLRVLPLRWMGFGLLLASIVGVAALAFGRPFLTSSFSYLELPVIGKLPMASAFLFDLGVFAVVVGATVLLLIAIAHQSVRSHRAPRPREPVEPQAEGR